MNNNYMDYYKQFISKKSKIRESSSFLLKFTVSLKDGKNKLHMGCCKKDLNNTG